MDAAEQIINEEFKGASPIVSSKRSSLSASDIIKEEFGRIPPEPPPPPPKPSFLSRMPFTSRVPAESWGGERALAPREEIVPEKGKPIKGQLKGNPDDFGYILGETREIKGVKGVKDGTYIYIGADKWKRQKAE